MCAGPSPVLPSEYPAAMAAVKPTRVVAWRIVPWLLAMAAVTAACSRSARPSPSTPSNVVNVLKVTGGDTIHVLYGGRDQRVRLIGVNPPEVPWYGGRGQCFGANAGLYAKRRLSGQTVRLSFDVDRFDRYGRLLAYIYLGDELFNLTLVRFGYAVADPVPPDTGMASAFATAQAEARQQGRGLWSACPSAEQARGDLSP